jgi:TolB-like protein/Flp pilus assembly protein TadD
MAVLPFKTIGTTQDEQYIGAGIADALTTKLSGLSQLKLRPSSTVLHYANVNPISAGRELSVDSVLDGQIQRSGSRMRVTVQLVGVQDGTTLWADTLDEDFTNTFQIEDAISLGVAERLKSQLTEAERKGLTRHFTQDADAYQFYMQGRYLWDKNTEEPMRKSIQYYQQAIDRDPTFALAYTGIADAYTDLVIQSYVAGAKGLPKVKDAALKALQIDPSLAEPHISLGVVAWAYDWDWTKAEAEFRKSAELDPDSFATQNYHAFFLMSMSRFDESIAEGKRAVGLNPASASTNTWLGYFYFAARRYGEAAVWLKKSIDLDPDNPFPHALLAADYSLNGQPTLALTECSNLRGVSQSGKDPLVSATTGYACAVSGDRNEAQTILARLKTVSSERYVDPYGLAMVYTGLGNNDAAFEWLERTYREHSTSAVIFSAEPYLLKLHSDARFQDLIRRVHLPIPMSPS